jgi:hypothetical protein
MICASYRLNGRRGYAAESANKFTNLGLPALGFVNARTTAASMGNVKIASSLVALRQREMPREQKS